MKHKSRWYHDGETRIRKAFLIIPKRLRVSGDYYETRWLETASWKQKFSRSVYGSGWSDMEWCSDE